jgi:small-conductance mechanosensitive channel
MEFVINQRWIGELIASLVLIGALLLVRVFLVRLVKSGPEILSEEQRRWQVRIKNTSWIAILIGLFFIWAPELQTFALSITAFALAVVIATRELITCVTGGILRTGARAFKVGDWLSVDGITGEVIDVDIIGLRLQEIDVAGKTYQFTGKTHYVLNSKLMAGSYSNLTFMKNFVIHEVQVSLQHISVDPEVLMDRFREITEKHVAPHREEAKQFNEEYERVSGLNMHNSEPQLFLDCKDFSHYVFTARLLVPTKLAAALESDITLEFVSLVRREGYLAPPVLV